VSIRWVDLEGVDQGGCRMITVALDEVRTPVIGCVLRSDLSGDHRRRPWAPSLAL